MRTLSIISSPIASGGGSETALLKQIHMSLVVFRIYCHFILSSPCLRRFKHFRIRPVAPSAITSSCVRSSAYLHVLMSSWSRTEFSKLLTILTYWLPPSRKLRTHSRKPFVTFISGNFHNKIPWSTRQKALGKSMNNARTPFLSRKLSAVLNQLQANANTVDRSLLNAFGLSCFFRTKLFNLSCIFSEL